MSKKLTTRHPTVIISLMESSVDEKRHEAVKSGRLSPDLLTGKPFFVAVRDDAPYVTKGQKAIALSTDGTIWTMIIHSQTGLLPITSERFNWVRAEGTRTFQQADDLLTKPAKRVEEPADIVPGGEPGVSTGSAYSDLVNSTVEDDLKVYVDELIMSGASDVITHPNGVIAFNLHRNSEKYSGKYHVKLKSWAIYNSNGTMIHSQTNNFVELLKFMQTLD